MAGIDREIEGEAIPMAGIKIGYLPQEPVLNPEHTVRQSVEEGLGELFSARKRLDEVYTAYSEPDDDFDKLATEQAELEAIIAAEATTGAHDVKHQLEIRAEAAHLPPWGAALRRKGGV